MDNYLGKFDFGQFINQKPKNNECCPDQVVGRMFNGQLFKGGRRSIDYRTVNGYYYISTEIICPIAIVLESPHDKEFNNPIGPAKGVTGTRFFLYFEELIRKSKIYNKIKTGSHDIVFMNSIQYQCSLGEKLNRDTKRQRDDNWIKCFEGENSCDIEKRLYAIKPYATINLCTKGKGSGKVTLQEMLQVKICCMNNHTWGDHPYHWGYGKGKIH
jgi:hypothetical protein